MSAEPAKPCQHKVDQIRLDGQELLCECGKPLLEIPNWFDIWQRLMESGRLNPEVSNLVLLPNRTERVRDLIPEPEQVNENWRP